MGCCRCTLQAPIRNQGSYQSPYFERIMATSFTLPLAELVGLFMESVLFGIFLVSFVACINTLVYGRRKLITWADRVILAVILIMAFISVWDIALFFKNVVDAFIYYTGPGGPTHVFSNLGHWVNVARGFNYGAQTLLGDSILIYRCWKVYFENWLVVAFPILLWFGILVCVIAACVIESNLGQSSFTARELSPFGTGFVSLTLSLNIIVTAMIAYRIWQTYSQSVKYIRSGSSRGHTALKRVMLTVIESGAIYSTALLILLGVFVSKNEANIPLSDSVFFSLCITMCVFAHFFIL
ncbi:hypothetical protein BDZ94DRAFT_695081 [Collybia nuda]|uniref:Uncharacterized protein n=1 Tax=Collybia nuda TaxID=64659 RepID=A0A9P5YHG0_9AGAR|nr:hypothetical protein BDZ94DRAFT_695081 [Collybia nuda]